MKKIQCSLKQILYAFLVLLTSFLFYLFPNFVAHADELVNFKFSTNFVTKDGYDFSNELKQIVDKLDKSNKKYFIFLTADVSSGEYSKIFIRQLNDTSTYSYRTNFYGVHRYVYLKDVSRSFTSTHSNKISLEEMNDILTNIDDEKRWSSYDNFLDTGYMTLFQKTDQNYAEYVLYASNYLENKTDYNLCFNEVCTESSKKLVLPHDIVSTYTENFKTFTKNIDRVEYTFEIPREMFTFEFNFSATWQYENAQNYQSYFVRPHLSRELASMTELLYLDRNKLVEQNQIVYYDTQLNPLRDTISLKFIVDFANINALENSTMLIHFDTNYAFTRNVIELSDPSPPISPDKPNQDIVDSIDKVDDYLKDDTPPNSDISGLGNIQGLLPPGPLDSLLNIPVQFLTTVTNSLGGKCTALKGKWVFDKEITFPCFDKIIYDDLKDNTIMNFLELIPCAFILILYFKHLYKKVDRATSMSSNSNDEWGVI